MKSLKRAALGGESFFVTHLHGAGRGRLRRRRRPTCPATSPTTTVAPGQCAVHARRVRGWPTRQTVTINTQWGGFKNMFGARGRLHHPRRGRRTGRVRLLRRAGGVEPPAGAALHDRHRAHGRLRRHRCRWRSARRAAASCRRFKSGEGLVFDFSGPGRVWTQTRNPNELLGWIGATLGHGEQQQNVDRRPVRQAARSCTDARARRRREWRRDNFVDLDVEPWQWGGAARRHRRAAAGRHPGAPPRGARDPTSREAAIESVVWISIGLAFALVVWAWFGGAATAASTSSGYLIE